MNLVQRCANNNDGAVQTMRKIRNIDIRCSVPVGTLHWVWMCALKWKPSQPDAIIIHIFIICYVFCDAYMYLITHELWWSYCISTTRCINDFCNHPSSMTLLNLFSFIYIWTGNTLRWRHRCHYIHYMPWVFPHRHAYAVDPGALHIILLCVNIYRSEIPPLVFINNLSRPYNKYTLFNQFVHTEC